MLHGNLEGTSRALDILNESRFERRVKCHFLKSEASRDKILSNLVHEFSNQREEEQSNRNP